MFIEELLFEALESGAIRVRGARVESLRLGGSLSIPRSLSALLGDRVRRLPDDQRRALVAAAVLGAPVDVAVLGVMLELPVGRVHELVERLVDKELLTTLGPVTLGFRTPLVHAVVLSGLEPDSLVGSTRAANAYQLVLGARTEEEASRIARHLAEAGERDRAAGFFATSGLWCLSARRLGRAVSDLTSALDLADLETRSPEELAEWVAALGRAVRHVRAGVKIPELVQRVAAHFETHPSVPDRCGRRPPSIWRSCCPVCTVTEGADCRRARSKKAASGLSSCAQHHRGGRDCDRDRRVQTGAFALDQARRRGRRPSGADCWWRPRLWREPGSSIRRWLRSTPRKLSADSDPCSAVSATRSGR
jgi:hypothetical protein